MVGDTPSRKLTTIFYADVADYSRHTGVDELGTHKRVMERLDAATEILEGSGGTVLRYSGDAILAEFTSVIASVEAATRIQQQIKSLNDQQNDKEPIEIRIGLHLGEVLQDRSEIFGDGVNIAARLEAASQPSGICISSQVHEQIAGKTISTFVSGGEQIFKNIKQPIHTFHWHISGNPIATSTDQNIEAELPLPSKPSIAVLAFENMSNDADQDFFADGISEDIITQLSKFRSFFVIARNSAFSFKGKPTDVKEISKKLGVRYIVEGSVRCAGKKVRITAQLIDAIEDKHLWADKFDRGMEDIFAVQDEVTQAIVTTIEPTLLDSERILARRKPTDNLSAWECYQRGLWHIYQYTSEDSELAMTLLERAVSLDPDFASAHGGIAFSMYVHLLLDKSSNRDELLARGLQAGKQGVQLDSNDPFCHVGLGRIRIIRGEHAQAIASFNRAIELNPSYATAYYGKAHSQWHKGEAAEAIKNHEEAIRLSPRDPLMWTFLASKAIAHVIVEQYDEALECAARAQQYPMSAIWAFMGQLCALGHLGKKEEARDALKEALQIEPDLSIPFIDRALPITDQTSRLHFHAGLLAAGVAAD